MKSLVFILNFLSFTLSYSQSGLKNEKYQYAKMNSNQVEMRYLDDYGPNQNAYVKCPNSCKCFKITRRVQCDGYNFNSNFEKPSTMLLSIIYGIPSDVVELELNSYVFEQNQLNFQSFPLKLEYLTRLHIFNSNLQFIQQSILTVNFPSLKILNLNKNNFGKIDNSPFAYTNITYLSMMNNANLELTEKTFLNSKIISLNFNSCNFGLDNSLTKNLQNNLYSNFLNKLYYKQKIDVDEVGGLVKFPFQSLIPLNKTLLYLSLQNNYISSINDKWSFVLRNIKKVKFHRNPWHCNCVLSWLHNFLVVHQKLNQEYIMPTCATPQNFENIQFDKIASNNMICVAPKFTVLASIFGGKRENVDRQQLKCAASGDPAPTIYWIEPNSDTTTFKPANVHSFDIIANARDRDLNYKLKNSQNFIYPAHTDAILNVTKSDGSYICIAYNNVGNVTMMMNVTWPHISQNIIPSHFSHKFYNFSNFDEKNSPQSIKPHNSKFYMDYQSAFLKKENVVYKYKNGGYSATILSGAIVGSHLLTLLIVLPIFLYYKKRKSKKYSNSNDSSDKLPNFPASNRSENYDCPSFKHQTVVTQKRDSFIDKKGTPNPIIYYPNSNQNSLGRYKFEPFCPPSNSTKKHSPLQGNQIKKNVLQGSHVNEFTPFTSKFYPPQSYRINSSN
ncbi:hypothetical protein A3Q56_03111 [Intoshia linei]|uniref:Ig-like domain-containing protein n=1 Tax=Intoshia linei TaxID=1819745 RepID=A0A177B635_9BILA|nr:hypothetical protein A3Q56_03111 [Intoshia linei]